MSEIIDRQQKVIDSERRTGLALRSSVVDNAAERQMYHSPVS